MTLTRTQERLLKASVYFLIGLTAALALTIVGRAIYFIMTGQ